MAEILNIGTSALLSLQKAINTTGHNIANVNTDGYSRQRVNLETLPPQLQGGSYIGSGVSVVSVERYYDQFLANEVRTRTSSQNGFQTYHDLATRLDGLLADPLTGLGPALDNFFGAIQDVSNNPGSLPERQLAIGEAQVLADRFHYLDSNFRSLNSEINTRITTTVDEINSIAGNIAELNESIVRATAQAGNSLPNDLLDARDVLVNRLAEKISVTTVMQDNGALNVMIGNGQPLVVGFQSESLQVFDNPFDSTQTSVSIAGAAGTTTDLSRFLSGGELGAVLDFRSRVLEPARNQLGLVAMGLTETFNELHQQGIDLNGQLGGDFFQPLAATVAAHNGNLGTATINTTIDDAGALTGNDYRLQFLGGSWTLTNLGNGSTQSGSGPFSIDGMTISPTGAPANGDTFIIQPTRQAATLFNVNLQDPENFAAASPLRASENISNVGTASVSALDITDATSFPLTSSVVLTFNPNALGVGVPGYDVVGIAGGPLAYDPATESNGKTFTLGGFDFSLSGTPQTGDEISFENNTNGTGDNRNALALGSLQTSTILFGGKATYQNAYGSMVADIAVKTRQAESSANTEQVLLDQAISSRDSVSGVNLDEEAANLIRFQQAYQAAAQVIAVADELFQTLINATRR